MRRGLAIGIAVWLLIVLCLILLLPFEWLAVTRIASAVIASVVSVVFVLAYHFSTSGHWKDSRHGMHIMVFSFVIAAILCYVDAAIFGWIPISWLPISSSVIYTTMAFLMGWRLSLLISDQYGKGARNDRRSAAYRRPES